MLSVVSIVDIDRLESNAAPNPMKSSWHKISRRIDPKQILTTG